MNKLIINKCIDWHRMWKDAVKMHLINFPTEGEYRKEMDGIIDDLSFVEKMYVWFNWSHLNKLGEMDLNFDEDEEYIVPVRNHHSDKEIIFSFSEVEDRSTEGGYDESGVEITFTYSLSNECFIDFRYEQW